MSASIFLRSLLTLAGKGLKKNIETLQDIEALPVGVEYMREVLDPWDESNTFYDQWRVTLYSADGFYTTDYYTGMGLRKGGVPQKPKIADVIYALESDTASLGFGFSEWCKDFGYSDDSIKALKTYKKCLEIEQVLKKYFGAMRLRQIRNLLQEY